MIVTVLNSVVLLLSPSLFSSKKELNSIKSILVWHETYNSFRKRKKKIMFTHSTVLQYHNSQHRECHDSMHSTCAAFMMPWVITNPFWWHLELSLLLKILWLGTRHSIPKALIITKDLTILHLKSQTSLISNILEA